jgi:hypothetical protein
MRQVAVGHRTDVMDVNVRLVYRVTTPRNRSLVRPPRVLVGMMLVIPSVAAVPVPGHMVLASTVPLVCSLAMSGVALGPGFDLLGGNAPEKETGHDDDREL